MAKFNFNFGMELAGTFDIASMKMEITNSKVQLSGDSQFDPADVKAKSEALNSFREMIIKGLTTAVECAPAAYKAKDDHAVNMENLRNQMKNSNMDRFERQERFKRWCRKEDMEASNNNGVQQ